MGLMPLFEDGLCCRWLNTGIGLQALTKYTLLQHIHFVEMWMKVQGCADTIRKAWEKD